MTLAQKLDELEKEIQDFKIIGYNNRDIPVIPQKLQTIIELMNFGYVTNYEFKLYKKTLPIKYIKNCLKQCEVNYRTDRQRSINLVKIKQRVKAAIHWFKEGCQWDGINILTQEGKFVSPEIHELKHGNIKQPKNNPHK
jgi:hypothetical protein